MEDYTLMDALRASLKDIDDEYKSKDPGKFNDDLRNNADPAALEIEILSTLLREAVEHLRWCSESFTFSGDDKASEGWRNGPAKFLKKLEDMNVI